MKNWIKIELNHGKSSIDTKMPSIPSVGDNVGFWDDDDYNAGIVESIDHHLDRDGVFEYASIYLLISKDIFY